MIVDPRDAMLRRLFVDAGISNGMRVLDLGCGYGKVTAMVAALVGSSGAVVGVDRDPRALEVARKNAAENVSFVEASIDALPATLGTFDAVVARRVLMYLRDPTAALRSTRERLRKDSIIAVQELDTSMVPTSSVPVPLHENVYRWVYSMVQREGANTRIGLEFPQLFANASFTFEEHRFEAVAQTAKRRLPNAEMIRAVMHRMIERGVATEAEIDIDTLDQRLEHELQTTGATFVGDMLVGAFGRVA